MSFVPELLGSSISNSPTGQTPSSKAPLACSTCRRQKRRCDKSLPACGLCVKMRRLCDYSESQAIPNLGDFAALQMRLVELESRLQTRSSTTSAPSTVGTPPPPFASGFVPDESLWQPTTLVQFPPDVLLDSHGWHRLGRPIIQPLIDIPGEVLGQLSDSNALQQSVNEYFSTVHTWLPMINQRQLQASTNPFDLGPDVVMLYLAVELVTLRPIEGVAAADHYIYTTAKRFVSTLEHSGMLSLAVLQSMVLIAVFEYGHGIYPAAWMTIGTCGRYSELLGLPDLQDTSGLLGQAQTVMELEERRRTWWAVIILDRVVCLGNNKRCMLPEPSAYEILPIDDEAWDNGNVSFATPYDLSTPFGSPPSPFARLCESSVLASRVMTHVAAYPAHKRGPNQPLPIVEATSLLDDLFHAMSTLEAEVAPSPTTTTQGALPTFFPPASDPLYSSLPQFSGITVSNPTQLNPYATAQFILLSATMLLQHTYSMDTSPMSTAEVAFRHRAVTGLRLTSARTLDALSRTIIARPSSWSPSQHDKRRYYSVPGGVQVDNRFPHSDNIGLSIVCPLILDAMYRACSNLAWICREEGAAGLVDGSEVLEILRRFLERLKARWRVAGEYERMLKDLGLDVMIMAISQR